MPASSQKRVRSPKAIAKKLLPADRVLIATHIRPDGDALGSMLALALGLEKLGKKVARLCADGAPPNYCFLPSSEKITAKCPNWPEAIAVAVDCDGLKRTGTLSARLERARLLIDIDHHASQNAFGQLVWNDPEATATGELIYQLLDALGVLLDPQIAACLYTSILTDSGRFSFANTRPRALRISGHLVEAGADPRAIARCVYEEKSLASTHLLGRALAKASAYLNGRAVLVSLGPEDFKATGALPSESEGIIDHLRAIGSAEVAAVLTDTGNGEIRASLRSQGRVDVSEIAAAFGGGGHYGAAGCTFTAGLAKAQAELLARIKQALPPS